MYQELRFAVLALSVAMSTTQAQEGKFIIGPRDFSCGKWTNTPKNTAQHDVLGPTVSPQLVQSGKGRIASEPALLYLPRPLMAGAFSVHGSDEQIFGADEQVPGR